MDWSLIGLLKGGSYGGHAVLFLGSGALKTWGGSGERGYCLGKGL